MKYSRRQDISYFLLNFSYDIKENCFSEVGAHLQHTTRTFFTKQFNTLSTDYFIVTLSTSSLSASESCWLYWNQKLTNDEPYRKMVNCLQRPIIYIYGLVFVGEKSGTCPYDNFQCNETFGWWLLFLDSCWTACTILFCTHLIITLSLKLEWEVEHRQGLLVWETSQELRVLSRSLSDCKSLTPNVMIQVLQFVSNSQLCH